MDYKLSIALITMNRADQLKLAIESCVASILPEKTQFVIVDNGSVDHTESVVRELKSTIKYDLIYEKEPQNLGVGKGRNRCFELSRGEYVFFLDDDAEIGEKCRHEFFKKSISYLDKNPKVASLTTEVVDYVFGDRPIVTSKTRVIDSLKSAYTFHEGTVFFRKSAFSNQLYMDVSYGSEGLSVSTLVRDRGMYNVFDPSIFINHNPKVDKWKSDDKSRLIVQSINNIYCIKKACYPIVFAPLLYFAYCRRLKKQGILDKKIILEFKKQRKIFCISNRIKKIKIATVVNSYIEFGLTVF